MAVVSTSDRSEIRSYWESTGTGMRCLMKRFSVLARWEILCTLQVRAIERVFAAPSDHILAVEPEPCLREIIRAEVVARVGKAVKACSPAELGKNRTSDRGAGRCSGVCGFAGWGVCA